MLRIIGGFEMPTEGSVLFEGKDITDVPPYRRRVNTVFQKYALFTHLNVFDNIAFGLKLRKTAQGGDRRAGGAACCDLVNMEGYEKRSVEAAFRRPAAAHRHRPGPGQRAGGAACWTSPWARWI